VTTRSPSQQRALRHCANSAALFGISSRLT
jgi:hypothetical protein